MKIEEVRKLSPLERLTYWIREREAIRLKKEAGQPPPWTDDEILQRYRFCNVRRMDDKVSRWLLENWYHPYFDHPNMLLACCLARFFNLPSTLEAIGFPTRWESSKMKRKLRALQRRGPIYNAAYMVRGNNGEDKVASVIDYTLAPLRKRPPLINRNSMERTWEKLHGRYGFGSFMAGQVTADLRHALKGEWADRMTWAPVGPGSARGLGWTLYGENRVAAAAEFVAHPERFTEILVQKLMPKLKRGLPPTIYDRCEAHDFQNTLCEASKYNKALFDEGRPKQLYQGGV